MQVTSLFSLDALPRLRSVQESFETVLSRCRLRLGLLRIHRILLRDRESPLIFPHQISEAWCHVGVQGDLAALLLKDFQAKKFEHSGKISTCTVAGKYGQDAHLLILELEVCVAEIFLWRYGGERPVMLGATQRIDSLTREHQFAFLELTPTQVFEKVVTLELDERLRAQALCNDQTLPNRSSFH